jgi:hypothetical protein
MLADDGDVTGCDGAPDELKALGRVERDPLVVLDLVDDILELQPAARRRVPFASSDDNANSTRISQSGFARLAPDASTRPRTSMEKSAWWDHRQGSSWGDAALAPFVANHRSLLRRRWHGEKLDGGTRSLPRPGPAEVRAPDTGGRR